MEANMRVMGVLMGKVKEIPSVDPTLTKSGFAADAKVVGDKLEEIGTDVLGKEDVVNDLESDAYDKPLSAAMGKLLKSLVGKGGGYASDVIYDNSESNLEAHDVQYAITLLASMVRGCLPIEGGTLTGENIYLDNGNARIQGNENALWMQALNGEMDNNNRRLLAIYNSGYASDVKNSLVFEDIINGKKQGYAVYGAHNKKSGYYVGDGGTSKTVDSESVGSVVFVLGASPAYGSVAALVCGQGAVMFGGGRVDIVSSSYLCFTGGNLTVKNIGAFNDTGANYYYYVL